MRIYTINRWTDVDREYFWLSVDFDTQFASATVSWVSEGEPRSSDLIITRRLEGEIEGFIEGRFKGDFRINSLTVYTEEGSQTVAMDPGESFEGDNELFDISYEDQPETFAYYFSVITGDNFAIYMNRLIDPSSAGVQLSKKIETGWSLPGVFAPRTIDQEAADDFLNSPYDEESGNEIVFLDDQLVFLRSTPAGNSLILAELSDVYSWEVPFAKNQYYSPFTQFSMGPSPETLTRLSPSEAFVTPYINHFEDESESIFKQSINNREFLATFGTYIRPLPMAGFDGGDRLAVSPLVRTSL